MATKEQVPGFPPSSWELQGQRLDGPALDTDYVRNAGCHIARQCVGMGPTDPRYYDALYPWDWAAHRRDMALKQHKCAFTVLMILRALGFALPEDDKPVRWRFSGAPKGHKAPLDPMSQLRMLPGYHCGMALPGWGDALLIGRKGDPSSTHALYVLGYEDDGHTIVSVDGGKGKVKERRRQVVHIGSDVCLYDKVMGNRPIIGHVNVAELRPSVVREYCLPG